MNNLTLRQEVERCLKCHNPPCSTQCCQGIEPANIIRSIEFDNIQGAYRNVDSCILCGECEVPCIRSKLDASTHIIDIMKHLKEEELK